MSFTVEGLSGTQEACIRLIWMLADPTSDVEVAPYQDLPIEARRELDLCITFASPVAPASTGAISTRELVAVAATRTLLASQQQTPNVDLLTCVTEAFACRLLAEADLEEAFLAGLLWGVARKLAVPWIELMQQLKRNSPRARVDGAYGSAAWRALQAVRAHTDPNGRSSRDCGYTDLSVSWAFVGATAMAIELLTNQLPGSPPSGFDRPAPP